MSSKRPNRSRNHGRSRIRSTSPPNDNYLCNSSIDVGAQMPPVNSNLGLSYINGVQPAAPQLPAIQVNPLHSGVVNCPGGRVLPAWFYPGTDPRYPINLSNDDLEVKPRVSHTRVKIEKSEASPSRPISTIVIDVSSDEN